MIVHLLNKLREFTEWGQSLILDLVAKYTPKNENEMFDIMNLLEDRLKHACSSIVMGTIKIFLNFTKGKDDELYQQVLERIQS